MAIQGNNTAVGYQSLAFNNDGEKARFHLERSPLHDPVAAAKLDEVYESQGLLDERQRLLKDQPLHPLVVERKASLALACNNPELTLELLSSTYWQRQHQRYVRTELWREACRRLGKDSSNVPELLGEDSLAQFGAYWSD